MRSEPEERAPRRGRDTAHRYPLPAPIAGHGAAMVSDQSSLREPPVERRAKNAAGMTACVSHQALSNVVRRSRQARLRGHRSNEVYHSAYATLEREPSAFHPSERATLTSGTVPSPRCAPAGPGRPSWTTWSSRLTNALWPPRSSRTLCDVPVPRFKARPIASGRSASTRKPLYRVRDVEEVTSRLKDPSVNGSALRRACDTIVGDDRSLRLAGTERIERAHARTLAYRRTIVAQSQLISADFGRA